MRTPTGTPPEPKPGQDDGASTQKPQGSEPSDDDANREGWPSSLEELFLFDPNFESCW